MWRAISITAVEAGAKTLAKKLEKMGLKVQVHVFKTGPGGTAYFGASNVEVVVHGPTDEYASVTFLAGGYGGLGEREIGGGQGWRPMAAEGLRRIMTDLKSQGWTPAG